MSRIRFTRIEFETKLGHYASDRSAHERRRDSLREVIDFHTDINTLLTGTEQVGLKSRGDWRFIGVDTSEDDYYIYGKLAKEMESEEKIIDEDIEDYVLDERDETNVARFLIHIPNLIMAFESKAGVGPKAPYRILEAVFNKYHRGEETIHISPVTDRESVRASLELIDKVSTVKLKNIRPTNPNPTEFSDDMDAFLNRGQIELLDLDASGDDIQMTEAEELMGGVGLAEEGHGEAVISGKTVDGEDIEVRTDENQLTDERELGDSDSVNKKELRESIRGALEELSEEEETPNA